jgi:hypothetical protein
MFFWLMIVLLTIWEVLLIGYLLWIDREELMYRKLQIFVVFTTSVVFGWLIVKSWRSDR